MTSIVRGFQQQIFRMSAQMAANVSARSYTPGSLVEVDQFRYGAHIHQLPLGEGGQERKIHEKAEEKMKDSNKIVDCSFQPDVAQSECCVCLDETKSHAFVPCGHLCVCGGSSRSRSWPGREREA